MESILKETQNYKLTYDDTSYFIKNKQTGIKEVETSILPQALKFLEEIQASLDAITDYSK